MEPMPDEAVRQNSKEYGERECSGDNYLARDAESVWD
jgi:hypothetical protein